ncbi:MAG: ATP-dependent helicase, partial [Candidatus Binatia bacterium]|nr:ATP-dependent helicase [Candidatus Binatia bacterium]
WYLDAGTRLGRTFEGFKQRWFHPKYNGFGVDPNKGSDAEIHERLKDICLSIEARDWFSLKEPIVNDIYVDLPVDARRHYAEMERDMFSQIGDSTVEAFGAAAMTNKCRQLAGGAVYIDAEVGSDDNSKSKKWKAVHNAKMEALDSCIEEAAGASMIVVYAFRSELARILKAYPGAVDLSTKDGMKRFKSGDATLGAAHPASLGHGVDGLQAVCNVITHLGHDWALDTYQQINERIGPVRQMQSGLDRSVFVNRIIARDTLDEQVIERRLGKRTVQEMLLEAMKLRGRT